MELLLFMEALCIAQEPLTAGIVLAPNSSSCVLTQPHTITHDQNPVN